MYIRFNDNGTVIDFLADEVEVTTDVDFDEYEDLNGNLVQDVRRSRLVFTLRGVPEEVTSTGTSWADLWDAAGQGNTLTFEMDPDDPATPAVAVLPDHSSVPALARYRKGSPEKGRTFAFKSKAAFAPGHATLTAYTTHSQPL